MHIYFSGIGGTGIGALALVAKQAGYNVSGSDKQESDYLEYLKKHGIINVNVGQEEEFIASVHKKQPIDWLVYSSAVSIENPDSAELKFCAQHDIKTSKRDEFINQLLQDKQLKMIAVAGTHGKTTTTAMLVWLFKQLEIPVSYSVGAKLKFGDMGEYAEGAKHFIYEADEFDHNFLAFRPYLSLITGIDWDHPDIYPSRDDYEQAFKDFVGQTKWTVFWQSDYDKLGLKNDGHFLVLDPTHKYLTKLAQPGEVNRRNAWQVIRAVHELTKTPVEELVEHMNRFPGLSRRFEELVPGLFTDYAHTPEKIRGALQTAEEVAGKPVVVVYEGLHNTRQHFIKEDLKHLFDDVKKLYVVPSYLAREDPKLPILNPEDIVALTAHPEKGQNTALDSELIHTIREHISAGDLVVCLTAGGGNSLDEWLRKNFS